MPHVKRNSLAVQVLDYRVLDYEDPDLSHLRERLAFQAHLRKIARTVRNGLTLIGVGAVLYALTRFVVWIV